MGGHYADEHGDEGELTFTNGQREAELAWQSGPLSESLDDRLDSGTDYGPHGVVNGTATIAQYDGSDEYTALRDADGRVLEFRTQASNVDELAGLLDALAVVDVDSWLTAMPANVIEAAEQPAVISDILTGIPLPDGFDPNNLADDAGIKDRYQLGARSSAPSAAPGSSSGSTQPRPATPPQHNRPPRPWIRQASGRSCKR